MFEMSLAYPFCHKEIESRYSLTSVLFVLVSLEYDGCQCCVALDRLGGADAAVLGAESAFEQVFQVILDASGGLGRIIIQVMNMYIT